jgi:hypothetical protein
VPGDAADPGPWNDARGAADCPAIDVYRQALHDEAVELGAPVADPTP